jgi:hypothetical protein
MTSLIFDGKEMGVPPHRLFRACGIAGAHEKVPA